MPIKTLHFTNAYHHSSGGIGTFYRELLATACQSGRRMALVVPAEHEAVETLSEHCRIYHVVAPRAPFFDRRYRLLLPTAYLPGLAGRVRQILHDEEPDLIEVCDKFALNWLGGLVRKGWLGLAQRPTLVGMSHERMEDNVAAFLTAEAWGQRLTRHYLGYCYLPLFDFHLANSAYTASELRAALVPGHERPIHVLPMGADVERFAKARRNESQRQRLLAQLGGNERTRLLLFAGRLSPEKNLPLLLRMMEHLAGDTSADYRLLIAGAGPLSAELERAAFQRFPRHVYLLGHVGGKEQLLELYADCDAFVHPNPREPFGIAPLEALAAGLPLVAPNAGGVLSYADESNAWLAEPQGAAFAQAVRAIFSDPNLCKAKLSRARWRAAHFNWSTVTAAFFGLCEELHRLCAAARHLPKPLSPVITYATPEKP